MRRKYILYSVMKCRHLVVITRIKAADRRFKRFLIAVTTVLYSLLAWTEQCHNLITTSKGRPLLWYTQIESCLLGGGFKEPILAWMENLIRLIFLLDW